MKEKMSTEDDKIDKFIRDNNIVNENYCDLKEKCTTREEWERCSKTCAFFLAADKDKALAKNREELKVTTFEKKKEEYVKHLEKFRRIYGSSTKTLAEKDKEAEALIATIIRKFRTTIENRRYQEDLKKHPWAVACQELQKQDGAACLGKTEYGMKKLLIGIKEDCRGDAQCRSKNKANAQTLINAFGGTNNRRRLVGITQEQADDASGLLGDVVFGLYVFSELGVDGVGDLSALASVGIPFLQASSGEAGPEARFRSLIEGKLTLVATVTANIPGLGPISDLFTLGHALSVGVNGSEACGSGECSQKLKQEMPSIALTAVLETFGNGHLLDLFQLFQIAERIALEEKKCKSTNGPGCGFSVINAQDVARVAIAATRGGCAIASTAIPVLGLQCAVSLAVLQAVHEAPMVETFDPFIKDVLNDIGRHPFAKQVLPAVSGFVVQGVKAAQNLLQAPGQIIGDVKKTFELLGVANGTCNSYRCRRAERRDKGLVGAIRQVAHVGDNIVRGGFKAFGSALKIFR
jgi:hypothetical protein